jgi:putative transposase
MEEFGQVQKRRLPHWDFPGATYFVTACLAESIPAEGLLDIARLRGSQAKLQSADSESCKLECWKRTFARSDWWLDQCSAVRHLADSALAAIVVDTCYFLAGRRYDLLSYVVMPSHFHLVFRPLPDVGQVSNLPTNVGQVSNLPTKEIWQVGNLPHQRSAREQIMHSLKLHTALECNRRLGRRGKFWQDESYDHCVRDDDELSRIIHYVEQNPVKAGLIDSAEQWPFSSARDRMATSVLPGRPLTQPVK